MPKYGIIGNIHFTTTVEIEAESEHSAKNEFIKLIDDANGEYQLNKGYSGCDVYSVEKLA